MVAKEAKSSYKVIGVMAGSSMDGLDIACVSFQYNENWTFEIERCETFQYDNHIYDMLYNAAKQSLIEQNKIDELFGEWIAKALDSFGILDIDFVSLHGHTIIHDPPNQISWQLGNGRVVANNLKIPTISDFRSLDVTLRGQGAPLVPIGDFQLFTDYDACLNLGGIANLSIKKYRKAWDVCPCNQVLNFYAEKLGERFDEGGKIAIKGMYDLNWYKELSEIAFFDKQPPKSLPNNFIKSELLEKVQATTGLNTYTHFIADRILKDLEFFFSSGKNILVTGGGAYNDFLVDLLNKNETGFRFIVPEKEIIDFKEAIVFAFLGILRIRNEINVLSSVTGAKQDSSSGTIHLGK